MYAVQVYCSALGWANTRQRSNWWFGAYLLARRLRANDDVWVDIHAKRRTRIVKVRC